MPYYDDLFERTRLVRAQAVWALKRRDVRLRQLPDPQVLAAFADRFPDLDRRVIHYLDAARSAAAVGTCLRVDTALDTMMRQCQHHSGAHDPVAGYLALLFATETITFEQDRAGAPPEDRVAALRSMLDVVACQPDIATMLDARAFFLFGLITATALAPQPRPVERGVASRSA